MTMKGKLPPREFSNAMHKIARPVSVDDWRDTPEWIIYRAGYNACVSKANSRILGMYDIPKTAERVFETDLVAADEDEGRITTDERKEHDQH